MRVTSQLVTENTIETTLVVHLLDADYTPLNNLNVDFYLDPVLVMRITSFVESLLRFRTDSFVQEVSIYSVRKSFEIGLKALSVKMSNAVTVLNDFYKPTSFVEFWSTFGVNSSVDFTSPFSVILKSASTFNLEEASMVRRALTYIEPESIKSAFISRITFSKVVKNSLILRLYNVKKMSSPFTAALKECKHTASASIISLKECKHTASASTISLKEAKRFSSIFIASQKFTARSKSAIQVQSKFASRLITSANFLNDCKNFVSSYLESLNDTQDLVPVSSAMTFSDEFEQVSSVFIEVKANV